MVRTMAPKVNRHRFLCFQNAALKCGIGDFSITGSQPADEPPPSVMSLMHPEATVHIVAELRPWIDIEFILAIRHTVVISGAVVRPLRIG